MNTENKIEDGGPAFPVVRMPLDPDTILNHPGMSLRQYASIHLKVPQSGLPWLDEMINEARRDAFAGQALAGLLADPSVTASEKCVAISAMDYADAMIEAGRVK